MFLSGHLPLHTHSLGVMGTGVYVVVLVGRMDFADVWGAWLRVVVWLGGLVSLGADAGRVRGGGRSGGTG